jgi:hypothetical protein
MKGKSMRPAEPLSFAEIGMAIGSSTEKVTDDYFKKPLQVCSEQWAEKLLVKLDSKGKL